MYPFKVLQLLDIKEYDHDYYLQVNLHLDEIHTLYWKVDHETAKQLNVLTNFSNGSFYRLSLHVTNQKSIITQTYREQSLRLEFICSDAYKEQLAQIKNAKSQADLDKLSFLSSKLVNEEPEVELETPKKKPKRLALVFSIVALLAILFTYTGHSILTNAQAEPDKQAADHDLTEDNPAPIKEKVEPAPETNLLEENIVIEEPEIPFFELHEGTSARVPDGMVALTFDDGPSQFSKEIVDVLKEFGVGGTFFLVTSNIAKFPGSVEYIYEHDLSIGTHSVHHINFAHSNQAKQKHELQASIEDIEKVIGEKITLFRPPYGHLNDTTEQISQDLGQRIVLWNNDPKDWELRNASKIVEHIKSTDVSGSIILLHETQATLEALPEIITYLQEQGLQIVSLH